MSWVQPTPPMELGTTGQDGLETTCSLLSGSEEREAHSGTPETVLGRSHYSLLMPVLLRALPIPQSAAMV